jgi:hypothetical protein
MRNSETVTGPGRRCTAVAALGAGLSLFGIGAYAAEVFDASANRVFHTFDGDEVEVRDRDSVTRYLEQFLHQDDSGQVFELHDDWEIVSDGTVFMLYHFNGRHFEWIEAAGIPAGKTRTHEHDRTDRFYSPTEPSGYDRIVSGGQSDDSEYWTTPEQGDTPILRMESLLYEDGVFKTLDGESIEDFRFPAAAAAEPDDPFADFDAARESVAEEYVLYRNEFGEPVFFRRGTWGADGGQTFGDWCDAMLVHWYFEDVYASEKFAAIEAKRADLEREFAEQHSIAAELINLGRYYETSDHQRPVFSTDSHFSVRYFSSIDDEIVYLNEEQVARLKNKWLVLNDKLRQNTVPFDLPRGAFYLKRKAALNRGLENLPRSSLVFEIKAKPEYADEFRAAISVPTKSASAEQPAPAAADGSYVFVPGNYWGRGEIQPLQDPTDRQECARLCDEQRKCVVASYHDETVGGGYANTCVLRSKKGEWHPEQTNISSWVKPK